MGGEAGNQAGDGLAVQIQFDPPAIPAGASTPSLEPHRDVVLTGSNNTGEQMLLRPVLHFLRGGWVEPSLPAGPQLVDPGESVSFRVTLPARPAERIGLQQVVAVGRSRRRHRVLRTWLAPTAGGSGHPFDLEDVGAITIGALLYVLAARGLTQLAFDIGTVALWPVVAAALAVVVGYAAQTHFYMRLKVWSREGVPASSSAARAGELIIMTSGITYLAVVVSSVLLAHGVIDASPNPGNGVEAVEGLERYFGLSLLDTVPGLHIPETFHLKAPAQYEGVAMGLVVTVYRLALLLPGALLAVSLFNDFRYWPTRGGNAEVVSRRDSLRGEDAGSAE